MSATISAMAIAGAMTLNAQTPHPQTPQQQPRTQPQTQQPATQQPTTQPQTDQQRGAQARSAAGDRMLTLTGCLQAEKDVPGRRPSMTERAGMGEDYILTNVKMSQGAQTSGIGLGSMYQIKGGSVKEDELKKHLGHQVEVTGSGRRAARAAPAAPPAAPPAARDAVRAPAPRRRTATATCRTSKPTASGWSPPPARCSSSAISVIKRRPKTGVTSRLPVASKRTVSFSRHRP
jgi:hypothetical protein